jgi:hypothetical protein
MTDGAQDDERAPGGGKVPGGKKAHRHHTERSSWAPPDKVKGAPQPPRSSKTMHHPAFRIGEIKHGK